MLTPPRLSSNEDETPDPRDGGALTISDVAQLDLAAEFVGLGGGDTPGRFIAGGGSECLLDRGIRPPP